MSDAPLPDPIQCLGLPSGYQPAVPLDECFDALYGLELTEVATDGEVVRGRVAIRDELRQQAGILHGGVIAALAEALASRGTWMGAGRGDNAVMGMSNDTSFLRPFTDGHVNAMATPRHRGRTRWLWESPRPRRRGATVRRHHRQHRHPAADPSAGELIGDHRLLRGGDRR